MEESKSKAKNNKNIVKFPNNNQVRNAFSVYEPSLQSKLFLSEEGRTIFVENFSFDNNQKQIVDKLSALSLKIFVDNYKGGCLDSRIKFNDFVIFGEKCDIERPLIDVFNLENNIYWKRVVEKKCKNRYLFYKLCREEDTANWHQLGVEVKLAELFEITEPEFWKFANFEEIIKKVSSLIEHLEICQMIPLKSIEKNKKRPNYKIYNVPVKDCHHGSLSVIGGLTNLKEISLKFGVENLNRNYDKRYFDFSYVDVENLSKGLPQLQHLEVFRIQNSRMDDRKTKIIVKSLEKLPIKILEFSCCNLEDDSGKSIGQLLSLNKNITELELRGNYIGAMGLSGIGYGIQNFKGKLDYIGISRNPVTENGVIAIGGGFLGTEHVRKIDFSGCDVEGITGAIRVAQIIGCHNVLEEIDASNLPFGEEGGNKLIEFITKNFSVQKLDVRCCDLTVNQECNIRLLIERNNYYKENPCVKKSYFLKSEENEIDEWMKRVKHPLLLKLEKRTDSIESFDVNSQKKKYEHDTIPSFITEKQRKFPTNSELLNVNFYDCFGTDSEIRLYDPYQLINEEENFIYDPNQFTEEELFNSIRF